MQIQRPLMQSTALLRQPLLMLHRKPLNSHRLSAAPSRHAAGTCSKNAEHGRKNHANLSTKKKGISLRTFLKLFWEIVIRDRENCLHGLSLQSVHRQDSQRIHMEIEII